MARLKFYYPIEELHGKIKGKFGAAQRVSKNAKGEGRPYSVNYGVRTTPVTEDEQAARTRFAAVQAMVNVRKKDGTKRSADQAAFREQSAFKTMTAYLWNVCGQEYDASLNAGD